MLEVKDEIDTKCAKLGVHQLEFDEYSKKRDVTGNSDKWIRCDEKLPELGKYVLVTDGAKCEIAFLAVVWDDGTCFWNYNSLRSCFMKITHWMPLPELPERRKEEV